MSRRILRALSLAMLIASLPLSNALAHCIVGGRFFPAMLATDDPCVADEMSLPTVQYNSANPSGREHDVEADFSKRITESFGITVASTWTRVSPPADAATSASAVASTTTVAVNPRLPPIVANVAPRISSPSTCAAKK